MSDSIQEISPRPIGEHCWYLSTGLSQAPIEYDLHNATDWLHIASSIRSVDLDLAQFDESITYCHEPYEYARNRTALLTRLVSELTMFNYIWGSYEGVVDLIYTNAEQRRKGGKTKAACWLVKDKYPLTCLANYRYYLDRILRIIYNSETYSGLAKSIQDAEKIAWGVPHIGLPGSAPIEELNIQGLGIYVVTKIRNLFAHGTMRFPEPFDYSESESNDSDLISLSSRIVLLTIQMLLLAHFDTDDFSMLCPYEYKNESSWEDIKSSIFLREVHLNQEACSQTNLGQMILF